jgi:nicotinate-nucleotide--dimethylbenzimidazole phosphoribosyltransferase
VRALFSDRQPNHPGSVARCLPARVRLFYDGAQGEPNPPGPLPSREGGGLINRTRSKLPLPLREGGQGGRLAGIADTIARIGPPSEAARRAARARQETLTKPPGSLGRLEELAVWLAGVRDEARPQVRAPVVVLAAADHGVARQGVSAYPSEVTGQMVANFVRGGAAVNVLARAAGARVIVVDAGVAALPGGLTGVLRRPHGPGTADMSTGPAMTRAVAEACVIAGIDIAMEALAAGADLLAAGEMGIGNTTAAAAITAVYTGLPAEAVTGRGTGVSDDRYRHKVSVVRRALNLHRPDPADPLGVLAAVGGFEIGVLVGVMLAGAGGRVPVLVDGFITTAAALLAVALCPAVRDFLLAAHRSAETGHGAALDALGLTPLLDLGLRLGEGTGALLALPLLDAAARLLDEMATFAEAGVSGTDEPAHGPD